MKIVILEKHKEVYGPKNNQARGYADLVLQEMKTYYEKETQTEDHNRLMTILHNATTIHNFRKKLFPDGNLLSFLAISIACKLSISRPKIRTSKP